jgi:hypothetical protein
VFDRPNFDMVSSNGANGQLGVATLFHRNLRHAFNISLTVVVEGRVLDLCLSRKLDSGEAYTLHICNLYLSSGEEDEQVLEWTALTAHIRASRRAGGPESTWAVIGDYNADASTSSNRVREAIRDCTSAIGDAEELRAGGNGAETATFVRAAPDGRTTIKTLDRIIFGGASAAAVAAFMTPVVHIPSLPHPNASDHRPLVLRWLPAQRRPVSKNRPRLPPYLSDDPAFQADATGRMCGVLSRGYKSPFKVLRCFAAAIHAAARANLAERKKAPALLNATIAATARCIEAASAGDMMRAHETATAYLELRVIIPSPVRTALSVLPPLLRLLRHLTGGKTPSEEGVDVDETTPDVSTPPPTRTRDLLDPCATFARIASAVPRVRAVQVGEEIISNPDAMAAAVAWHQGQVWSESTTPASVQDDFLNARYPHGALPRFDKALILEPSLGMIFETLDETTPKAPGPDGIPLGIYKRLANLIAPVLLHALRVLMRSTTIPPAAVKAGFNEAILFCFAKKPGSLLVEDLRPIGIFSYSNRILSSVVKKCLQPAFDAAIHQRQSAFLTGRPMSGAITRTLHEFYLALQERRQLHLLQIDFKQAYDRVNRRFLLQLLERWGLPPPFLNVISCFMQQVRARVWCGSGDTWVEVLRSIPQGGPLSVLLVLPYIQVVQELLDEARIKHEAFADDITAILETLHELLRAAIEAVTTFTEAGSDAVVNQVKTELISARELTDGERSTIAASAWPNMTVQSRGKLLGMRYGRDLLPSAHVWDPITVKAEGMAANAKRYAKLSPSRAIVYANVFTLSLFSHVAQFSIAPTCIIKRVDALLRRLCTPAMRAIALEQLYLQPGDGGPTPTLQRFEASNAAAAIRCLLPIWREMGYEGPPQQYDLHPHDSFSALATALSRPGAEAVWEEWKDALIPQHRLRRAMNEAHRGALVAKRAVLARVVQAGGGEQAILHWRANMEVAIKRKGAAHARWRTVLALCNALPVLARVHHRGSEASVICRACALPGSREDIRHVFGGCTATRAALSKICLLVAGKEATARARAVELMRWDEPTTFTAHTLTCPPTLLPLPAHAMCEASSAIYSALMAMAWNRVPLSGTETSQERAAIFAETAAVIFKRK